ncbi:MAG: hypothetical protein IGR76_09100 [Synechococcales cyanobacterium T60_A2020_003]|nr:hypothetical protein [Synechococcales cyanobacterium T60_A2020_003]
MPAFALDDEQLQVLLSQPPRLQWLEPDAVLPSEEMVTQYTISETSLTPPSLWWIQSQYGGDLLSGWVAAPGTDGLPPHVDLVVNEAEWRTYNYWERYALVTLFGRVSQEFGYITRVFNEQRPQPRALAAYLCEPLVATDEDPEVSGCQVYMDVAGLGISIDLEDQLRGF